MPQGFLSLSHFFLHHPMTQYTSTMRLKKKIFALVGALESTVVTLAGKDYLYVIGTTAHVISGYQ